MLNLSNDFTEVHPAFLSDMINKRLYQAEALIEIAAMLDIETINSETMNHYLWALRDLIQEARKLYVDLSKIQKEKGNEINKK